MGHLINSYFFKFPRSTQTEWEKETQDIKGVLPMEEFMEFLEEFMEFLEKWIQALPDSVTPSRMAEIKHERPRKQKATIHTVRASSPDKSKAKFTCVLCNGDKHGLYLCTTFKGMSVYAKNKHIKTAKLCFNCLDYGHRTKEFRSTSRCKKCTRNAGAPHAARSVPHSLAQGLSHCFTGNSVN